VKSSAAWAKGGLTLQEKKMIDAILKRVNIHTSAIWFLHPVDPIRHGAPTWEQFFQMDDCWQSPCSYFDVVKHPMDLSTIASKLKSGQYGSRQEFADDFMLMLSNAYLFNPVGTQPHSDALKIEDFFKKRTLSSFLTYTLYWPLI
jgi:transcription initiation factor TFIID subunit 2